MAQTTLTQSLSRKADHNHCPKCNAKSVATLIVGDVEHGYCPKCDLPFFPPLTEGWSKWNPKPSDFFEDPETAKGRRERMMGRGPWG